MSKWGGPRVTRMRARMAQQLPLQCWRCGLWITTPDDLTIGHIIEVDVAPELMWDDENIAPEHSRCNYAAGARYGNRKRRRAAPPPVTSRQW